jgi:hypothetical protein
MKLGRKVSWNTTHKYVQELVEVGKIRRIPLPHSKLEGRTGLTVYELVR